MKKVLLALSIAAFIATGSIVTASTNNDLNSTVIMQDGKKKATATKKKDCSGDKKLSTDCDGGKSTGKKECCSHDKTSHKKTTVKKTDPTKK